eukprot:6182690-Pleurochrysis_carterae.AAC.4
MNGGPTLTFEILMSDAQVIQMQAHYYAQELSIPPDSLTSARSSAVQCGVLSKDLTGTSG